MAVVDGTTLKITPFRTANMPPPMSLYQISAESAIVDVAFSPGNSRMAVLHHKGIDVYAWQTKDARSLAPKLLRTVELEAAHPRRPGLQICFSEAGRLHLLRRETDAALVVATYDERESGNENVTPRRVGPGSVLVSSDGGEAHAQDRSGRFFRLGEDDGGIGVFPTQLPWAESADRGGELFAVGLSRNGHLYAGGRLLTKSCSSFLLTPDHLVLTTSNHLLKFVHLTNVEGSHPPPLDVVPY